MLSRAGEIVRRADPDRFLTGLFAPAALQPALFTLYAFNHELARAREAASEPVLARIRLQWWREVVEGEAKSHEVATPLREAIAAGLLCPADLLAMIEAREQASDAPPGAAGDWVAWLRQGPGSLAVAAGRLLGAHEPALPRLRDLGAGYGVAGILGNLDAASRRNICLLPPRVLANHAMTPERVIAAPRDPALSPLRREMASIGLDLLGSPQKHPPGSVAAGLIAVLARRDLRRPDRIPAPRGFADRAAVFAAALRAHI